MWTFPLFILEADVIVAIDATGATFQDSWQDNQFLSFTYLSSRKNLVEWENDVSSFRLIVEDENPVAINSDQCGTCQRDTFSMN